MTVTQIECFEAVCETQSFSRAAGSLYVSQPAISKNISRLEQELGHSLFERDNNVLILTQAGELFRDFITRARKEYQEFEEQLDTLSARNAQTFRLGCPETWNPNFFAVRAERCFKKAVPNGNLSIEAYRLSDLLIRLRNGKLDFALSHDFYSPNTPGICTEMLAETGLGILYSRHAFREPVEFKDLVKKPFLVFDEDIEKRVGTVIRSLCEKRGCTYRIRSAGQVTRCLFELSRGSGVMLFTDWDNFVSNDQFGFLKLEETLPVRLIYNAETLNDQGRAFMKELIGR